MAKKTAILHFAYAPNIGGVEKLIEDHAFILSKAGIEVTVITGNGRSSNDKVIVKEVPEIQSLMNFDPVLQEKILDKGIIDSDFYKTADRILEILKKELDDCTNIIIHNVMTVYRNLPFTYSFKKYIENHPEKNFLIWVHDHMYIRNNQIIVQEKKTSDFESNLITTPIRNVKYIVISNTFKKNLLKILPIEEKNVLVIPNGVNVQSFLEIENDIWKMAQSKNLLRRFPLILSPVNILERKNIEYSLLVIACLKTKYPDIVYLISGQPSKHRNTVDYLNKIKNLINKLNIYDNVVFLSETITRSLTNKEMHDLYSMSDLIFYFSDSENFGIPILEAGLTKTPIFTSEIDIFKEIGLDNVRFVNTLDPAEKTAETIDQYISRNKTIALSHHTKTNYNLENIINKMLLPLLA